jgi:hypothetical protein
MAKRNKDVKSRDPVLDLLYGGESPPRELQKKPLIVSPDGAFAEATRLRREADTLRQKLTAPPAPFTAGQEKTAAKLLALTDKVAGRKPVLPPFVAGGDAAFGRYSVVLTPPFASMTAVTGVITGNPDTSSGVDQDTGEMSCKVVTDTSDESSGTAEALLATMFRPMFSSGKVTIHVDLDIDFAWWVNSIGTKAATSRAQGLMRIFKAGTFELVGGQAAYLGWLISKSQELDFNFGTYPSPSWAWTVPVTRKWYQFVLSLECAASGVGWIGSIAGSQVTQRVRSIRFDFEWHPIAEQ